jgi:hypothetical protein
MPQSSGKYMYIKNKFTANLERKRRNIEYLGMFKSHLSVNLSIYISMYVSIVLY